MGGLSLADALARIKPDSTLDELKALAREVSARPKSDNVILYTGGIPRAHRRTRQQETGYSLVDDTDRAKLLLDENFLAAVARAAKITEPNPLAAIDKLNDADKLPDDDPDKDAAMAANAAVYGVKGDVESLQNSFWGEASREFVEGARGNVSVMIGTPAKEEPFALKGVLWAVELPALLALSASGVALELTLNDMPAASLPRDRDAALAALVPSGKAIAKRFSTLPAGAGQPGAAAAQRVPPPSDGTGRPAARITDPVLHPLPGILQPGPGSPNVLIGNLLAWRGVPAAAAAAIQSAKSVSDTTIQVAEAATLAAAGTPGAPVAKAAEETTKAAAAATMGSMISGAAGGADIHICATPLPLPPHGPGVVIDGSQTVLINGLPACRMGDTIVEAVGPPNKIVMGLPTVLIGG